MVCFFCRMLFSWTQKEGESMKARGAGRQAPEMCLLNNDSLFEGVSYRTGVAHRTGVAQQNRGFSIYWSPFISHLSLLVVHVHFSLSSAVKGWLIFLYCWLPRITLFSAVHGFRRTSFTQVGDGFHEVDWFPWYYTNFISLWFISIWFPIMNFLSASVACLPRRATARYSQRSITKTRYMSSGHLISSP